MQADQGEGAFYMSDSEKDLFGDSDGSASPQEPSSPASAPEPVHRDALLKRYAPSHAVEHAWTAAMPSFLNIEPLPFNAQRFADQHDGADDDSAATPNTIRWTYAAAEAEAEQKVTRISNARIVEWSDGSRTLQVGAEQFEIKTHTQADPAFVCTQQDGDPLLATRQVVFDSMKILPSSMASATHRRLVRDMARKQQSGQIRVGSVNTTEDPDKVQREIERAEQAKDKARRKLAAQRDDFVTYTDHSTAAPASPVRRPRRSELDASDNDMIDDEEESAQSDEDEEEEAQSSGAEDEEDDDARASRLNQIKRTVVDDDSD